MQIYVKIFYFQRNTLKFLFFSNFVCVIAKLRTMTYMPFREGLTKVKLNGEEFYIDKNGNRIEE